MRNHAQILTDYLSAFVEELVQAGVKDAVISPGSRSTPLALLMAEHPVLKIYVNVDERSAGFFALGVAKASKRPVVLLSTSGTAAANYFPAIAEAKLSEIPLIVLTADRPHELRNVGAPQAMDQLRLFGSHVKDFVDMALPENNVELLRYAKWHGSRAVDITMKTPRGPVHLNFPLREPLMPILDPSPYATMNKKRRHVHIYYTHEVLEEKALQKMITECKGKKGVVVAGPLDKKDIEKSMVDLAFQIGWPILADPLSGLRSYGKEDAVVIDQYDAFLKSDKIKEKLTPEVVIRFGAMPVSKSLKQWLETLEDMRFYIVDPGAAWKDPIKAVTDVIHCDERFIIESLLAKGIFAKNTDWLSYWQKTNEQARFELESHMRQVNHLEEGKIVHILREEMPDKAGLFISNSMPIRDVDTYFPQSKKKIKMLANRGVNGIDGVISSALGASTFIQPMYLLIGDLAFYHDMNGLLMAKKYNLNMTIIIVNNNGGGIFSFLPQSSEPKYFESLFATSTHLNFRHTSILYGAHYYEVKTEEEFVEALDQAGYRKKLNIIEIHTNRYQNTTDHHALWGKITQSLESMDK